MTRPALTSHRLCFAVGCAVTIAEPRLFCPAHWELVPGHLRAVVMNTLRDWDSGGPLGPYALATLRARLVVAHGEKRWDAANAIRTLIEQLQEVPRAS